MSEDKKDLQTAILLILKLSYNGQVEEAWARDVQERHKLSWDEQFRKEFDQKFPDTRPGGSYKK